MPEAVAIGVRHIEDYWDDEEHGVAQPIIDAAAETRTGLIVLGVHSRRKLFSRTMTQKLLLDVGTPVLIAKTGATRRWRRVVVAVDFSECSARAIKFVGTWTGDAEVHMVHAVDAGFDLTKDEAELNDRIAKFESNLALLTKRPFGNEEHGAAKEMAVSHHVAAGSAREILREKVDNLSADLLVVGTGGRREPGNAALGSVAAALIDQPPCDLVAIPGRRGEFG